MTRRTRQVGEMLREELSDIIRREVKDPRIGFMSITAVDVPPDLRIGPGVRECAWEQIRSGLTRWRPCVRHRDSFVSPEATTADAADSRAGVSRRSVDGICRSRSRATLREIQAADAGARNQRRASKIHRRSTRFGRDGMSGSPWRLDLLKLRRMHCDCSPAHRCVLMPTHQNVDADGLSSPLAMMHALRQRGIEAIPLVTDARVPGNLDFLPGIEDVLVYGRDELPDYDMLCLIDCADRKSAGRVLQ